MKSDKAPSASAVSFFSLSDIDDEDVPIRAEKPVSDLVKAQNPNLCIKSTTKKRKAVLSEGPDEPFLDVEQAVEQILMRCREKDELIESMKKSASVAAESAAAAAQKIISLRKEIKDSEAYAAQKDVDAQRERESMIAAFKKDATIAVLKARILMASEASSIGQDISLWDLEAWMDKLAKLNGEDPEARNLFDCSSGKALKSSIGEASKVSAQKIPIQIDDAEMDNLGQSEETLEEQAAAGGSNTLGKEGK